MTQRSSSDAAIIDALELEAAGYTQAMPRQFSIWSLGALSFTLTCTWLGSGASIGLGLTDASGAGALWSLLVAGVMSLIVSAGMAELASAYPVAGAQYYWSFMVAPKKYKSFASYLNGWMSILGWWLAIGSVSNFVASMILEIASVWYSFETQRWQLYLMYVAIIWLSVAMNILGSRLLPYYSQLIFVLSVTTLGSTIIALFVIARNHHASPSFMFTDTRTQTGWSNEGFTFLLAVGNAVFGYMGSDCGAHLCEEIANPSKNVPKVIMMPLVMGLLTAFPFAASLIYSIKDLSAVLAAGMPLLEIYYQGTGSKAAASVLLAFFAFCMFGCVVAVGTTASRTIWAVSRDGAMPFSGLWKVIHPAFNMPANSMLLTGTCVTLYGLIFLGSTTAFAAMVNATILFLQTSCVIPQAILLFRNREEVLPERYFSLGKLGPIFNAVSVVWVVFMDILFCIPVFRPVTPENMSYVSVVLVGLISIVIIIWFTTKKGKFTGPNINMELMHERRRAALHANLDGVEVEQVLRKDQAESEAKEV